MRDVHLLCTVCAQKEVPLGNPDVLVCSVGTEIFFEAASANPEANKEWGEELDQGWNRAKAMQITESFQDLKPQVYFLHVALKLLFRFIILKGVLQRAPNLTT